MCFLKHPWLDLYLHRTYRDGLFYNQGWAQIFLYGKLFVSLLLQDKLFWFIEENVFFRKEQLNDAQPKFILYKHKVFHIRSKS